MGTQPPDKPEDAHGWDAAIARANEPRHAPTLTPEEVQQARADLNEARSHIAAFVASRRAHERHLFLAFALVRGVDPLESGLPPALRAEHKIGRAHV